jgi:general secretion pathway protein K
LPGYLARGGPYKQTLELVRGEDGQQLRFQHQQLTSDGVAEPERDPVVLLGRHRRRHAGSTHIDEQGRPWALAGELERVGATAAAGAHPLRFRDARRSWPELVVARASARPTRRRRRCRWRAEARDERTRKRGAALLLVLWLLVLLIGVIACSRSARAPKACRDARSRAARRRATPPRPASRSRPSTCRIRDGDARWVPDGRAIDFAFAGQRCRCAWSTSRRRSTSTSPPDLLSALMQALGVDFERSRALAGAIADWRDRTTCLQLPGRREDPQYADAEAALRRQGPALRDAVELRLVLGMTRLCSRRMRPYVTLDTAACAAPNPAYAASRCCRRWPERGAGGAAAGPARGAGGGRAGPARRPGQRNV